MLDCFLGEIVILRNVSETWPHGYSLVVNIFTATESYLLLQMWLSEHFKPQGVIQGSDRHGPCKWLGAENCSWHMKKYDATSEKKKIPYAYEIMSCLL